MIHKDHEVLVNRWQTKGCLRSRNKLVMDLLDTIKFIASQFRSANSQDDLINEGVLGLIYACDIYDNTRGPFLSFAKAHIRYYIVNYMRRDNVIPRGSVSMHCKNLSYSPIPRSHLEILNLANKRHVSYNIAQKYALSLGLDLESCTNTPTSEDATFEAASKLEGYKIISNKMKYLSPYHQDIFNKYFLEEKTYKDIGESYGITAQRAHQLLKSIVNKLKVNN